MYDWQKNGMVKWDAWQYLFMSDTVKFQAEAISEQLAKHRELVCREYLKNTDRLIASQDTVCEIINGIVDRISYQQNTSFSSSNNTNLILNESVKKGVSDVLSSLSYLNDSVTTGFNEVANSIDNLSASFNWFTDRFVWHLNDLKKIIQSPIDNKALNYRERGIQAYQNGWFDEALKEFSQAETFYEYDFITQQYLGDLYLHYKKNLEAALKHFSLAAKYSFVKNATEQHLKISSWAELHVGLVYYKWNNFEEAAKAAYRALQKHPSAEAFYQVGHYLSLTPQKHERLGDVIKAFEQAIRRDPVYFFKIDIDHKLFESDLFVVKNEMKALKEALWREERDKAQNKIEQIKREFNSFNWYYNSKTSPLLDKLKNDIYLAEEMFKHRQSYLDFRIIQKML